MCTPLLRRLHRPISFHERAFLVDGWSTARKLSRETLNCFRLDGKIKYSSRARGGDSRPNQTRNQMAPGALCSPSDVDFALKQAGEYGRRIRVYDRR